MKIDHILMKARQSLAIYLRDALSGIFPRSIISTLFQSTPIPRNAFYADPDVSAAEMEGYWYI